ncbi:MAG: hypothetical protein KGJ23_07225 [Euryarchaeota archaeon]|nr:hypothetical protein [Euryarchaeota archaeon]MDE1836391.1 hypothetical protein [Euryarchaeota archaeon]MDE1879598.1 hypothetical protein [Euryarchaeota archaeon]MDE2044139.1 hypothetical protein [Thermoplasmata archaeon]
MEDLTYAPSRESGWPWWMDPYSDNPIAFGILFALIIALMIGGMLVYRFLFVHQTGATPIEPPYVLEHALVGLFARP